MKGAFIIVGFDIRQTSFETLGDVLSKDVSEDIIQTKFFIKKQNHFYICGTKIKEKVPFFEMPITSSKLHIYMSNVEFNNELSLHSVDSVMAKLTCLKYKDCLVFIPILHTMELFM